MKWNSLVPELVVTEYDAAKTFYVNVFGFNLCFERQEDRFGYFDLNGAQLMLVEDAAFPIYQMQRPGPKGKGLHFQVELPSIAQLLSRLKDASISLKSEVAESWYRQDDMLHGQREFFVEDIEGYLFRFYEYLGEKPA